MDNIKTPSIFEERHSKSYDDVIKACIEYPNMSLAASSTGIPYKTFARIAKKLGCWKPNPSGKGMSKPNGSKFKMSDILEGKYPQYASSKLRVRLISEGYKEAKCECCGITEWNGQPAPLEVDHIDGNNSNHILENLRILCPNCHAQTPTHSCKKSQ
jgi:hypothetical protein